MSNFSWNPALFDDAMKLAGAGLEAATIFTQNAVKETLSVPAPRISAIDKHGGRYYVAGFKLKDMNMSPYLRGSRLASLTTFRFPTKGMIGPPRPIQQEYRTAPAIKGDPPRKLSGRLRASIQREMLDPMKTFEGGDVPTKGRVGTNVKYARRLEFGPGGHEFMLRTLNRFSPQIRRIVENTI